MLTVVLLTAAALLGQVQLSAPPKVTQESVEVRYARAQLQLAEANLRRLEESNKRLERSVPSSIVAEYQDDVRVARRRFQQAKAGRSADGFLVWLERAEAERQAADTAWKNAQAVNQRAPGTYAAINLERFRLRAEVARLQLERGRELVSAGREDQLQWQADLLDNQVQRLKDETREGTQYPGAYPYWWW